MRPSTIANHLSAFLLFLAPMTMTDAAHAAAKSISTAALHKLIDGLGLKDTGDHKTYVLIENQGPRNIAIFLRPVDDGQYVQMYASLGRPPEGKVKFLPSKKMLQYNDNNQFYFTMNDSDNLFLQARISAAVVTPQLLREQIDALESATDETADLWDADQWKRAQKAGCRNPGSDTPFSANVALVTDNRSEADDIHARSDRRYKIDEPFLFYIEPANFACTQDGEYYKANFSVSIKVLHEGKTIIDQVDIMKQQFTSAKGIDHVGLNIKDDIKGFFPGDFIFHVQVKDLIGNATADSTINFGIVE